MHGVGSLVSQAQPSHPTTGGSQDGATIPGSEDGRLPACSPVSAGIDSRSAPLAERLLCAMPKSPTPATMALGAGAQPAPALLTWSAPGLVPSVSPVSVALPPAVGGSLSAAPGTSAPASAASFLRGPAPVAAPVAAPGAPVDPAAAIDPAKAARMRANRRHRRRYMLRNPFGLRDRPRTKTRKGDLALPGRLSELTASSRLAAGRRASPRTVARLAHRLTRHRTGWHWFRAAFHGPVHKTVRQEYADFVSRGLEPMAALVLTGLMANTGVWLSRGRRARLIAGLELLRPPELGKVIELLFAYSPIARAIRRTYVVQERLELYQGGDSFATYLRFADRLAQAPTPLPPTAAGRALVESTPVRLAPVPQYIPASWEAHGRTLQFYDRRGVLTGLKLRKDATDATALEREDIMNQCFARWKAELGLLSTYPKSVGMLLFSPSSDMRAAVAARAAAHGAPQFDIGHAALMAALLYEAPANYQVHLHEVSELTDLHEASHKVLHDAGLLAGRLGLVHMSPADFYHNREKDRRWYWNVDEVKKAMFGRVGTGRLDRVEAGVRYYNAGPSGLRDLKHLAFYDEVGSDYGNDAALALTSTTGDFLLAWTLSVSQWFKDHGQQDMGLAWQQVLQDGFATWFAAFTGRDRSKVARFLDDIIDWPLLTRQFRYFCSTAYVADVTKEQVPRQVLNAACVARTRVPDEGWDPQRGWMLDGDSRDLGPKNGPFPITELIAALYLTTRFAVALRQDSPAA